MARSSIAAITLAALAGALIWALSPEIAGAIEPWDAGRGYYPLALLAAGAICGISMPKHLASLYLGAVLGQLIFMLIALGIGALIGSNLLHLMLFSLALIAGALFGERVRDTL